MRIRKKGKTVCKRLKIEFVLREKNKKRLKQIEKLTVECVYDTTLSEKVTLMCCQPSDDVDLLLILSHQLYFLILLIRKRG